VRTGSTHPVRPLPFPAGPIGLSLFAVAAGFDAGSYSSLRIATLLEAHQLPYSRTHQRLVSAPLLGFGPLQRSTDSGARMSRKESTRPAPSVLSVSHALDGLLRPSPYRPCFMPAALLGFHRIRALVRGFRLEQGAPRPGFLSGALSSPVTTALPTVSSHALRRFRVVWTFQAPADRSLIKGFPIELPGGHHRVSITKDPVCPTVANREHRPP
jgi:hypothetical protein